MSECIGRFFGGLFWGWLADNCGRRSSLLIALTGCVIFEILTGLRFLLLHMMNSPMILSVFIAKTTCGPYLECFVEGL